jgi:hypothetical protein
MAIKVTESMLDAALQAKIGSKEFIVINLDGLSSGFVGNWFFESVGSTDEVGFVFKIKMQR